MKEIKLTELEDALALVLKNIDPIEKKEFVSLFEAGKRVLAQNLICKKPLPAFNNSSMDGYAVKLCDAGKEVNIGSSIFAGDEFRDLTVEKGVCHKIMTGGIVPESTEAIVPFEDVKVIDKKRVILPKKIKKDAYIRFKGEEKAFGEVILPKGTLLLAGEIALLASQGVSAVEVFVQGKVAVISSGNELVEPWEKAKEHQIYNSNSIGIYSFFKELGATPTYVGALPDDKEILEKKVKSLKEYDLIVSSGGVSVGEADYTVEIFKKAGLEILLHGINAKPGKHGMFGKMGKTYVLGLPGNPLSSMSMFLTFVSPLFCKLSGRSKIYPNTLMATVKKDFSIKGKKSHIIYGMIKDGEFEAFKDYQYNSGMLTPLAESNGFIITKKETSSFKRGDKVKVILQDSLNLEDNISFKS